jgi:hypothetical protein
MTVAAHFRAAIGPLIDSLLGARRPSTVVRLVVPVVVATINSPVGKLFDPPFGIWGPLAHVFEEVLEAPCSQPAVTDGDPASAVIGPSLVRRTETALPH